MNGDLTSTNNMTQPVLFFAFPKRQDEPFVSAFCHKVHAFFKATSTPFEHRPCVPHSAPKQKLPYIEYDGKTVADSDFCIQHLVHDGITKDLDAELTPQQRADTRAWQGYLEEKLYPCVVKQRWLDEPNYTNLINTMLKSLMWPVRAVVGWQVSRRIYNSLWAQGTARHSDDEVLTVYVHHDHRLLCRVI